MWWIVASLVLLGIILMFVETLLVPGVGVAGVLSLASLGASCWYAFTYMGKTAGAWTVVVVCVILVAMLVTILRAKTWKRFELDTAIDSRMNGETDMVKAGEKGTALTRLAPMGTAEFEGVSCEVKSHDNRMIAAGTPIEVVRIEDNKVIVKTITE